MEAILGTLLHFEEHRKRVDAGPIKSGEAQIYLFTGVRYERGVQPPPKSALSAKGRKRKRV